MSGLPLKCAGLIKQNRKQKSSGGETKAPRIKSEEPSAFIDPALSPMDTVGTMAETNRERTLKDAVKPKNKRNKVSSNTAAR